MENKEIVLKQAKFLDNQLVEIIEKNIDNKELKAILNGVFLEKGMQPSTVNAIFSWEKQVTQLNEYEKLNLIRGINQYFYISSIGEEEKERRIKAERNATNNWINGSIIEGREFFAEKIINQYIDYKKMKEELEISEIKFENVIKCDEYSFICAGEYKKLMDLMEIGKVYYVIETQREARYIKVGDRYIEVPMVDDETVDSIEEAMEDGTFEDSQITLGYLLEEDSKEVDFNFYGEEVGTLKCDKLRIIDGNHRLLASTRFCNKYKAKHNHYPDRKFSIRIVIGTEERLKRIVKQSFLRAKEITEEYKDTLTDNNINKFVTKIIEESNMLKEITAKTYDEMVALKKKTTRRVIKQAVEYLKLDLNSIKVMTFKPKKIAESLELLFDFMSESNIEFDYYNIYGSYIYFAYKVSELGNKLDYYELFIDKLKNIKKEDIKKLKLGNKNYNSEEIIKYFDIF